MTDIVKGMAREAQYVLDGPSATYDPARYEAAMRAALIWLANNVSKEMQQAALQQSLADGVWTDSKVIAAAIRAAAEEEEKQ